MKCAQLPEIRLIKRLLTIAGEEEGGDKTLFMAFHIFYGFWLDANTQFRSHLRQS